MTEADSPRQGSVVPGHPRSLPQDVAVEIGVSVSGGSAVRPRRTADPGLLVLICADVIRPSLSWLPALR